MAEIPHISPDDIEDVKELTEKLTNYIFEILEGSSEMLGVSVIVSAMMTALFSQCKTIEDCVYYREVVAKSFDSAIRNIRINPFPPEFSC